MIEASVARMKSSGIRVVMARKPGFHFVASGLLAFDIKETPYWDALPGCGFVSGKSTHADRLSTIRQTWEKYGVMVDTHTADGLKVGIEHCRPGLTLICLETTLPAKFEETIREALGREPVRPAGMENIESLPQHCKVMDADVEKLKAFIVENIFI
jgi:threonine synthase